MPPPTFVIRKELETASALPHRLDVWIVFELMLPLQQLELLYDYGTKVSFGYVAKGSRPREEAELRQQQRYQQIV